jgi:hypothetical protein
MKVGFWFPNFNRIPIDHEKVAIGAEVNTFLSGENLSY